MLKTFLFLAFLFLIGCFDKSATHLDQLLEQLNSSDLAIKNSAILEIGRFGPEGKRAVPKLILILNNEPSRGIRTSAAYALRAIGTKEAIKSLDDYKK